MWDAQLFLPFPETAASALVTTSKPLIILHPPEEERVPRVISEMGPVPETVTGDEFLARRR